MSLVRLGLPLFFFVAASVPAQERPTIADLLIASVENDSNLNATKVGIDAAKARLDQQRASRWASINLTGNLNRNDRFYADKPDEVDVTQSKYSAKGSQLEIKQPLIKPQLGVAIDQAQQGVMQAAHQSAAAQNELLVKVVQLWIELANADEAITASQSQLALHEWQVNQLTLGVERGVQAITSLEEAKARSQAARAEILAAQYDRAAKFRSLEQLIGSDIRDVVLPGALRAASDLPKAPALPPTCTRDTIDANNSSVQAALASVRAAEHEVTKQLRTNLPSLDLVASVSHNRQGEGSIPSQSGYSQRNKVIGLQLTWPMSSGLGSFSAKNREAVAGVQKAQFELEAVSCIESW